jgi:hypothetical protein
MSLQSNDNKRSHDNCFCSTHNNLILVLVSVLLVARRTMRLTQRTGTVRCLSGSAIQAAGKVALMRARSEGGQELLKNAGRIGGDVKR